MRSRACRLDGCGIATDQLVMFPPYDWLIPCLSVTIPVEPRHALTPSLQNVVTRYSACSEKSSNEGYTLRRLLLTHPAVLRTCRMRSTLGAPLAQCIGTIWQTQHRLQSLQLQRCTGDVTVDSQAPDLTYAQAGHITSPVLPHSLLCMAWQTRMLHHLFAQWSCPWRGHGHPLVNASSTACKPQQDTHNTHNTVHCMYVQRGPCMRMRSATASQSCQP
jgi:hypothetical protein